jgi:hypothetical protein
MALAASGEGAAIVPSNVSIPHKGVKAMSVTYRGTPIGGWVLVAWDRCRFFPPFALHFVNEQVTPVHRDCPNRALTKRMHALQRPKLSE